jgi:hypothetical protein
LPIGLRKENLIWGISTSLDLYIYTDKTNDLGKQCLALKLHTPARAPSDALNVGKDMQSGLPVQFETN